MTGFRKTTAIVALMGATALVTPAIAQDTMSNPTVGGAEMMADMNIVENAMNSPIHTTLVAAVQAAGLAETLQGEGPFTVFAPTDDAFAALPEGTVDALLLPENLETLQQVLTCHVVAANAMSDAIGGMIADDGGAHPVETLGGCTLTAEMDGDEITLTDERGQVATVTTADVRQSNGVIHVIDTVLLPAEEDFQLASDTASGEMDRGSDMSGETMASDNPTVGGAPMMADMNIIENAVNSPIHTTLVAAVQQANLVETLQGEGPFTVFAPTDEAFAALPDGTVETLMMDENREQLAGILTAHVVPGNLTTQALRDEFGSDGFAHLTTVSGDALSVGERDGQLYAFDESGNNYLISTGDVMQSNGVIHVVDGVLLPK